MIVRISITIRKEVSILVVSNLDKKEVVSLDCISNQEFNEVSRDACAIEFTRSNGSLLSSENHKFAMCIKLFFALHDGMKLGWNKMKMRMEWR